MWERFKIIDRTLRTLTASLGPAGGKKGYEGITGMNRTQKIPFCSTLLADSYW